MENTLKICKVRNVKTPCRAHATDAGIDFFVPEDIDMVTMTEKCKVTGCQPKMVWEDDKLVRVILAPGESVLLPSGIKMKVPEGHMLQFTNKSGIASKRHLLVGANVVDTFYEGECHINLHNVGNTEQVIEAGDKIVQGILIPVKLDMVEDVGSEEILYAGSSSDRGQGGFGSSGTK